MSNPEIPLSIDALKPFEQGSVREGGLALAGMNRLEPLVIENDGEAMVRLAFYFDDERRRVIEGWIRAELVVQCQRCLEAMRLPVESNFQVGVVDSEAMADQLPASLEPMVSGKRELPIREVLEDELIMCLPDDPVHEESGCSASATLERINRDADDAVAQAREHDTDNPFRVLAGLGSGGKDQGGTDS
ncbi:YceD family protein [Salicola sp. Rm-C-2C1-2]|uniref:YceD family protein n=1 Tax=Salicola sp. Rm-C-2C1-2 TaxID=3141321 RepID=UPI0032E399D1